MRTALASVILLVAACGDDGGVRHLDGGNTIDSPMNMIDAPVVPTPVTVTVTSGGTPQANVKVYFLASDSAVISNALTDATGVASALMPNGGTVTAIDPYPAPATGLPSVYHDLYTFEGVKPGDHLKLAEDGSQSSTMVDFTLPVDATSGVYNYSISTPCSRTTATPPQTGPFVATLYVSPKCATTSDVLVASLDPNGQIISYFYVPNQAITATTDLSAKTYAAATTKTYTISNGSVFGGDDNYSIVQMYASSHGLVVNGGPYDNNVVMTQMPGTFTFQAPTFTAALDLVGITGHKDQYADQFLVEWGAQPANHTYTTDLAARVLTDPTSYPTVDPTTHSVSWTEETSGLAPDVTMLVLDASRTANNTNVNWTWHVAAPHMASVTLPTLPTDVFDFNLMTTDSYDLPNFEGLAFAKFPGGYDAIRANIFSTNGPTDLIATATGTMAIEFVYTSAPARTKKPAPKAMQGLLRFPHAPTRR